MYDFIDLLYLGFYRLCSCWSDFSFRIIRFVVVNFILICFTLLVNKFFLKFVKFCFIVGNFLIGFKYENYFWGIVL